MTGDWEGVEGSNEEIKHQNGRLSEKGCAEHLRWRSKSEKIMEQHFQGGEGKT